MFVGVYADAGPIESTGRFSEFVKRGRISFVELDKAFGFDSGHGAVLAATAGEVQRAIIGARATLGEEVGIHRLGPGRMTISLRLPIWGMGGTMMDFNPESFADYKQNWARVTVALPANYRLESSSTAPVGMSLPVAVEEAEEYPWLGTSTAKLVYEITRGTTEIQLVIVDDQAVGRAVRKSMIGPAVLGAGIGLFLAGVIGLGMSVVAPDAEVRGESEGRDHKEAGRPAG